MRIGCDLHTLVDSTESCLDEPCRAFCPFSDIVTGQRTRGSGIEKDTGEHFQSILVVVVTESTHLPDPASDACFTVANLSVLNHSNLGEILDDDFRERIFSEGLFAR